MERLSAVFRAEELPELRSALGGIKHVICPKCLGPVGEVAELVTIPDIATDAIGRIICSSCAIKSSQKENDNATGS